MVFVDDSVSACSRARVDSEDFHVQRLGTPADNPAADEQGAECQASVWHHLRFYVEIVIQRFTERTCPNESVAVTVAW